MYGWWAWYGLFDCVNDGWVVGGRLGWMVGGRFLVRRSWCMVSWSFLVRRSWCMVSWSFLVRRSRRTVGRRLPICWSALVGWFSVGRRSVGRSPAAVIKHEHSQIRKIQWQSESSTIIPPLQSLLPLLKLGNNAKRDPHFAMVITSCWR
jgi:hypothetical protein